MILSLKDDDDRDDDGDVWMVIGNDNNSFSF